LPLALSHPHFRQTGCIGDLPAIARFFRQSGTCWILVLSQTALLIDQDKEQFSSVGKNET
jgi:hypothetical protein